jgi:hypothetical protein
MVRGVGADWRSETVEKLRSLILQAQPNAVEEAKWRKPSNPSGVPTFSCSGLICTVATYKDKVSSLARVPRSWIPRGCSTPASTPERGRAIDIHEDDEIDEDAFVELVREAVALNRS